MTSINTNLSSLIIQKNLTKSTNALDKALERLTTGFKINLASDNAANYSISESMSSKLSSYMVAEENTSMGLDLIRTQSSTLDTIQNLTTRLRALAEQAHNGTYGAQSLEAINQEAGAIIDEITRIGNNAEYNGIKLFDNALSQAGIPQLKSNGLMQEIEQRDTSGMTKLADVDENETLAQGTYSISSAEELAKLARMQNGEKIAAGSEFVLGADIDLSAYSKGDGWKSIELKNNTFDGNGHTISNLKSSRGGLFNSVEHSIIKNIKLEGCEVSNEDTVVGGLVNYIISDASIENCSVSGYVKADTSGLLVGNLNVMDESLSSTISNCYASGTVIATQYAGGVIGSYGTLQDNNGLTINKCYTDINAQGEFVGGIIGYNSSGGIYINSSCSSGSINGTNAGGILGRLSQNYQGNILNNVSFTGKIETTDENGYVGIVAAKISTSGTNTTSVNLIYDSNTNKDINLFGKSTGNAENLKTSTIDTASNLQVGIDSEESSNIAFSTNISISALNQIKMTNMQRQNSLEKIDKFLSELSEAQTKLGAIENRLTSTIESIGVNIENLTSSRSTLKDVDVAKESSQMLKNQILQQASATLLATANQTPSLALRLLGNM